jgi:hypothetical protein
MVKRGYFMSNPKDVINLTATREQLKFLSDVLHTPGMGFTLDKTKVASETDQLLKEALKE